MGDYLYLQFKEHINRVDLKKLEEKNHPELELVVDFILDRVPHGMCYFKQESNKVYMVGGERTIKALGGPYHCSSAYLDCQDQNHPGDAISRDIYVLDSSKGKISAHLDPHFPKPIAPKINARAFGTIEGKIYVMSFKPCYYLKKLPSPVFECYDIKRKVWEELPAPPHCFDQHGQFTYGFHFVVGPKIYLRTWRGFYRYHVPCAEWEFMPEVKWGFDPPHPYDCGSDDEWDEWEMEAYNKNKELDISVPISPAAPYHSICFAEPGKGGLAVGYTDQGLVGYWFSDYGELLDQDVLHELNKKLPPTCEYGGGKVCSAGKNKFCLILSGHIDKPSWSLGVATFDVKYNLVGEGGSKCSFYHDLLCYHQFDNVSSKHSNINHYEDYQLHDVNFRLYDYLQFQDAFVISSESKSGLRRNPKRKRSVMGAGFQ